MYTKRRNYSILTLAVSLVVGAYHQAVAQTAFVPNDPYFFPDLSRYAGQGQWHLVDQVFGGNLDVNVQEAWNSGITGKGVTIGFVSGGFETAHPDLAPNYAAADSWDFVGGDAVPDPVDNITGTMAAGVAAARGGNGIGVTGAAPYASIAGLRIDSKSSADIVAGILYHSSGSNTNIDIKVLSAPSPYPSSVLVSIPAEEKEALRESAKAGTIQVVAAGDTRPPPKYGAFGGDSNKHDFLNESSVIAVASLSFEGKYAESSSFGNNVFVTAPSSAPFQIDPFIPPEILGIVTTDLVGPNGFGWREPFYGPVDVHPDYTNMAEGTVPASALVGGVLALAKEVQPNLDTRFAKHLLVRTSAIVDPDDNTYTGGGDPWGSPGSAWLTNAAGNHFNQNYGFGLIDASKLVSAATQYAGVTELITETTGGAVNQTIPDDGTFATAEFTLTTTAAPLEDILVTLTIDHEFVGDIEAYLVSPEGTSTRLMSSGLEGFGNPQHLEWTLLANAFWGENGAGVWTLKLTDISGGGLYNGEWTSFEVEAHFGDLVSVPEPGTTMLLAVSGIVLLRRRARTAK
ncbi:MAG TPA: S8 family serine peptidase [Chthoniobacterales bacterium]